MKTDLSKVANGWCDTSKGLVPQKSSQVEVLMRVKYVETQRPSFGVDSETTQVSSSSLDHGSNLQGPSSKAFRIAEYSATLIYIHSLPISNTEREEI
ncbi:hypothetical protein TNCV_2876631 [Trichonephila clavipes]|nr:hypothetical protein TNCV_2876631 [Trichonephila clavipes]